MPDTTTMDEEARVAAIKAAEVAYLHGAKSAEEPNVTSPAPPIVSKKPPKTEQAYKIAKELVKLGVIKLETVDKLFEVVEQIEPLL